MNGDNERERAHNLNPMNCNNYIPLFGFINLIHEMLGKNNHLPNENSFEVAFERQLLNRFKVFHVRLPFAHRLRIRREF